MIVEKIAEELDVRDGSSRNVGIGKVPREENKGHVADVIRVPETRDMSNLQWRVPVRKKDLRRILDLGQPTRIHEFLDDTFGTWVSHKR